MLMRGFSRVDEEGRIPIPKNMRRETNLGPGQLVEIKVQGPTVKPFLTINRRKGRRRLSDKTELQVLLER